ncbi:hypothetical protein LCGC14_1716550, partial [marine sediment metagenome]
MAFSRPSVIPILDENNTLRVSPGAGKEADGYAVNDILPAGEFNYLLGFNGDWLQWISERSEDGATASRDLTLTGVD